MYASLPKCNVCKKKYVLRIFPPVGPAWKFFLLYQMLTKTAVACVQTDSPAPARWAIQFSSGKKNSDHLVWAHAWDVALAHQQPLQRWCPGPFPHCPPHCHLAPSPHLKWGKSLAASPLGDLRRVGSHCRSLEAGGPPQRDRAGGREVGLQRQAGRRRESRASKRD